MGKIKIIKGDLFTCPTTYNLAHCVSRDLKMGAGIAVLFKRKFKSVDKLKAQHKKVGECCVLNDKNRRIYYLVTKENYWGKPTYKTLRASLIAMRDDILLTDNKLLAMPMIGCGLDKLVWNSVKNIIENVFEKTMIDVVVYKIK